MFFFTLEKASLFLVFFVSYRLSHLIECEKTYQLIYQLIYKLIYKLIYQLIYQLIYKLI